VIPFNGDPELIRQDVLDGHVSIEAAARDYGVVVAPDTLQVTGRDGGPAALTDAFGSRIARGVYPGSRARRPGYSTDRNPAAPCCRHGGMLLQGALLAEGRTPCRWFTVVAGGFRPSD